MSEKSSLHPIYEQKTPWEISTHSVWIASTVALVRNLEQFLFPSKLAPDRQAQVVSLVFDGLKGCGELKNPGLFKAKEMKPFEKEFLQEHFLVQEGFHKAHGSEGFIVDDSGEFLGAVNLEDHLQLQLTDTEQGIEQCWNRLLKIEEALGKHVGFAFNPRFGFLTSDPAYSGTGLRIRLFLHIPAILHTGELPEVLGKDREEEIIATGIQGSASEMIGDLMMAENSCTTGLTEEYLLTSLRMWATKIVIEEINIRKRLKKGDNEQMKNKVARALGLLTHSFQLETIEALNSLSLVRLGIELGWVDCPPTININQIFFNCRRAHLMNMLSEEVPIPELPRKRAEYLHTLTAQLQLKI